CEARKNCSQKASKRQFLIEQRSHCVGLATHRKEQGEVVRRVRSRAVRCSVLRELDPSGHRTNDEPHHEQSALPLPRSSKYSQEARSSVSQSVSRYAHLRE